jgi:hypothetical protein
MKKEMKLPIRTKKRLSEMIGVFYWLLVVGYWLIVLGIDIDFAINIAKLKTTHQVLFL